MDREIGKDLSDEEIEEFIRGYINAYRKILEEEYPDRKEEDILYTTYPFEVRVFLSDTGITLDYIPNKTELKIEIKRMGETPSGKGEICESMVYSHLMRFLDNPEDKARRDITSYFEHEDMLKFEEERLSEEAEKQLEDHLESLDIEIQPYLQYVSSIQKVFKKTKNKKINEILYTLHLQDIEVGLIHMYLRCKTFSLFDTLFDSKKILSSSIYLATTGLYIPAIALLRQYLEIKINALFFDSELKKYNKSSKTYAYIQKKKEKWISKGKSFRFTGEYGVLGRLLDPDSDYHAIEIMRVQHKDFDKKNYRAYIEYIYSITSSFVHYGGDREEDNLLSLDFVEYNEKLFNEWYVKFTSIVEIFSLLFFLKFPEAIELKDEGVDYTIPELSTKQIEKIKEIYGNTKTI